MNEEEKKTFKFLKNIYEVNFKSCTLENNDIKNIVNIIEKQSKEIEKLKKNNGYHLGFVDGGIAKRYEMENKIEAKIEEITSYAYTSAEERDCQDYAIQVLKELLGE